MVIEGLDVVGSADANTPWHVPPPVGPALPPSKAFESATHTSGKGKVQWSDSAKVYPRPSWRSQADADPTRRPDLLSVDRRAQKRQR